MSAEKLNAELTHEMLQTFCTTGSHPDKYKTVNAIRERIAALKDNTPFTVMMPTGAKGDSKYEGPGRVGQQYF